MVAKVLKDVGELNNMIVIYLVFQLCIISSTSSLLEIFPNAVANDWEGAFFVDGNELSKQHNEDLSCTLTLVVHLVLIDIPLVAFMRYSEVTSISSAIRGLFAARYSNLTNMSSLKEFLNSKYARG